MQKAIGIDNWMELVEAVAEVKNVGGKIFEDGKVNWKDAPEFPALFSAFNEFTDIDYGQLTKEALDLDDSEKARLSAYYAEQLDLPQDDLEKQLEDGFTVVVEVASAVVTLMGFIKGFKKS